MEANVSKKSMPIYGKICALIAVVFLFFAIFPFASVPENAKVYQCKIWEYDGDFCLNGFGLPADLDMPNHYMDAPDKEFVFNDDVQVVYDEDSGDVYLATTACSKDDLRAYVEDEIASSARTSRLIWFVVFGAIAIATCPFVADKIKSAIGKKA